jgi:hypothetical protein
MDLATHLQRLEEQLLDPAVRKDPAQLHTLLTDDFREFGSSGRSYTKAEITPLLQSEPSAAFTLSLSAFAIQQLAPEIALATYISTRTHPTGEITRAQRSSLWIYRDGRWQMHFHQGTRIP